MKALKIAVVSVLAALVLSPIYAWGNVSIEAPSTSITTDLSGISGVVESADGLLQDSVPSSLTIPLPKITLFIDSQNNLTFDVPAQTLNLNLPDGPVSLDISAYNSASDLSGNTYSISIPSQTITIPMEGESSSLNIPAQTLSFNMPDVTYSEDNGAGSFSFDVPKQTITITANGGTISLGDPGQGISIVAPQQRFELDVPDIDMTLGSNAHTVPSHTFTVRIPAQDLSIDAGFFGVISINVPPMTLTMDVSDINLSLVNQDNDEYKYRVASHTLTLNIPPLDIVMTASGESTPIETDQSLQVPFTVGEFDLTFNLSGQASGSGGVSGGGSTGENVSGGGGAASGNVSAAIPGSSCGEGKVYDCVGNCFLLSEVLSYMGDGFCDDGYYGMDLLCPEFNYDAGDCIYVD